MAKKKLSAVLAQGGATAYRFNEANAEARVYIEFLGEDDDIVEILDKDHIILDKVVSPEFRAASDAKRKAILAEIYVDLGQYDQVWGYRSKMGKAHKL